MVMASNPNWTKHKAMVPTPTIPRAITPAKNTKLSTTDTKRIILRVKVGFFVPNIPTSISKPKQETKQ